MPRIIIRDLKEDTTLDRQAMRAIAGGARSSGPQLPFDTTRTQGKRIIDYPTTRPLKKSALFK